LEYAWKYIAMRAGVIDGSPTFGAGIRWKSLTFDLAMAQSTDLGNSQRVSLGYAFGKPKGSESDFNPDLSSVQLAQHAEDAINLGYYAEAERLLRAARRVKQDDEQVKDRLERLQDITPYIHSAVGADRSITMTRRGINEYLYGKNVDGLWRLTYAYSLDKGQSGLQRVIDKISHTTGYQVSLYKANSPLTLTQQVLSQALIEFRAQHYDEAVGLCQRVISLEPNNALAYKRLGSSLYALRQYEGAQGAWQKAMEYETDPVSKAQLKTFIDLAHRAALGLPENMPGQNAQEDDDSSDAGGDQVQG
jgi:tetratricopeptide (TPR) repeat protein